MQFNIKETQWTTINQFLRLIGEDGNVFAILGKAQQATRKAGWSKERLDAFMKEATSGNYDNVLRLYMENFQVE